MKLSVIILLIFQAILVTAVGQPQRSKTLVIKLRLKTASSIKVEKAPLKYNKQVAFSFTLDDGYRSAFLCAYPLLNGGRVSLPFIDEWKNDQGGDGGYSNGLFFSDGCGHKIPFRLAAAINGASLRTAPTNRGNLSWEETKTLYQSGWDLLNHSYRHSTKHGTDYEDEVFQNNKAVKQQLGFEMSHFVVPGGESDPGYDMEYAKAAFKVGLSAVATTSGMGPLIEVDKPVELNKMIHNRVFIRSDSTKTKVIDQHLQNINALIKSKQPVWYNEFTHGVGNSNLWGISLLYTDFKYYMTTLAKQHGMGGTDKLWMAPWQEVYEYLWIRDRIKVTTKTTGKDVRIEIALPEIPANFRYRAITLSVNTASHFTLASRTDGLTIASNGSGKHNLLNIRLGN